MIPIRLHPRPVRTLARRIASSPFARDLHWERHTIAVCVAVLFFAVAVNVLLRDYVITWHGLLPVHPVVGNCGDYCGTDAGLLPAGAGR